MKYPFNEFTNLALAPEYTEALHTNGLTRVELPHGEPAWLVTRHAEARLVLGDKRFSRALAHERDAPRVFDRVPAGIVSMDPPQLTAIRSVAAKAFTARRVEGLREHVRQLVHRLIGEMRHKENPDLVTDFALPIPVSVICELLGVPVEDQERFRAWNDALMSTNSAREIQELAQYIGGLIGQRVQHPADDLLSSFAESGLPPQQLVLLCIAILVAGYEATSAQIPNFLITLLDHPTQFARLVEDPSLVDNAVEELLRFVPLASSAMFAHYAMEDVQVGEHLVREGDPVLVSIGAANHDEARFDNPGHLDVCRDAQGHLAFGYGLHHCVGSALGRLELQEALRGLVTLAPDLRIAGDVEWKTHTFFRGPLSVPVSF